MALKPTRVGRAFGELLVITASVLLAFALEAWWADQNEQVRLREMMVGVREEFLGVQAELDRTRAVHEETARALQRLLSLMGPKPTDAEMASLSSLWLDFRFSSTDAPSGALTSLVATGDISTLRDPGFRARLNSWPADLADYLAVERMYAELQEPLRAMVGARSPIPPGPDALDYTSVFPTRPQAVLTDFVIENAVGRAVYVLGVVIKENRDRWNQVEDILAEIDGFLAGR